MCGQWETLWKGWGECGPQARLHFTSSPTCQGETHLRGAPAPRPGLQPRGPSPVLRRKAGRPSSGEEAKRGTSPRGPTQVSSPRVSLPQVCEHLPGAQGAQSCEDCWGGAWGPRQVSVAGKRRVSFPGEGKSSRSVSSNCFVKVSLPPPGPRNLPRQGCHILTPIFLPPVGGWEQRHAPSKKQLCHVVLQWCSLPSSSAETLQSSRELCPLSPPFPTPPSVSVAHLLSSGHREQNSALYSRA